MDEWNPLGDKASTINDLNGYRTEAIDILSTYEFFSGLSGLTVQKAVKKVIEQAFDITVDENGLNNAAERISKIIDK